MPFHGEMLCRKLVPNSKFNCLSTSACTKLGMLHLSHSAGHMFDEHLQPANSKAGSESSNTQYMRSVLRLTSLQPSKPTHSLVWPPDSERGVDLYQGTKETSTQNSEGSHQARMLQAKVAALPTKENLRKAPERAVCSRQALYRSIFLGRWLHVTLKRTQ